MVGKAVMLSLPREAIDRGRTRGDFVLSFRKQASSLGCGVYGQVLPGSSGTWAAETAQELGELKSAPQTRTTAISNTTASLTKIILQHPLLVSFPGNFLPCYHFSKAKFEGNRKLRFCLVGFLVLLLIH